MSNLLKLNMMIFKKHNLYSHKQKKEKEIPNQNKTPNFCRAVKETKAIFLFPVEYNRIILIRYC